MFAGKNTLLVFRRCMMLVRLSSITWLSWCLLNLSIVKVPNLDSYYGVWGVILGHHVHILFFNSQLSSGFSIHF